MAKENNGEPYRFRPGLVGRFGLACGVHLGALARMIQKHKHKIVVVSDLMQRNYRYELSEPVGRNFHPEFTPELTPKQMLTLGVFGGVYLRDCAKEFPKSWFARAKFQKKGSFKHDPTLNLFGVNASQPLSVWRKKGWINEAHDPRGWFQWYCRYYMGRRLPGEDERQIKRWKAKLLNFTFFI